MTPHSPLVAPTALSVPQNKSAPPVTRLGAAAKPPTVVTPMAQTPPPATVLQKVVAGPQTSRPLAQPRPPTAPRPLATLPTSTPTTTVVDKSLWIYISNVSLPQRRRGWTESGAGWHT